MINLQFLTELVGDDALHRPAKSHENPWRKLLPLPLRGSCRAIARLREFAKIFIFQYISFIILFLLPPSKPAVLPPPSMREGRVSTVRLCIAIPYFDIILKKLMVHYNQNQRLPSLYSLGVFPVIFLKIFVK